MKFKISKYMILVYVFILLLACSTTGICLYVIIKEPDSISAWISFIIGIVVLMLVLYDVILDFSFGSVTVDDSKLIMKVGLKRYEHNWTDFVEYGFVRIYVGNGCLYWVYFSDYVLSEREYSKFMKKTRKDLDHVAYFKYHHRTFKKILEFMPDEMSARLKEEETEVFKNMTWLEKRYH